MSSILAIDPGNTRSGWVVYGNGRVLKSAVMENRILLGRIWMGSLSADHMAIEMVASYGMPVGRDVFETVWWAGRFTQAWPAPENVFLIYRQDVKLHLCGNVRAKDPNVRQALIDLVGPPGVKRSPGPTYGVAGDMWAALGVAVTAQAKLLEAAA